MDNTSYVTQLGAELAAHLDVGDQVDPLAAQACDALLGSPAGAQLLARLDRIVYAVPQVEAALQAPAT
ncbi:hypothetical protein ACFYS8_36290 [Kitasatospora sp. NPDC004615]|uniref:hypothetical protein n=1 Tax=Kitasatospora sp. NPDC004615 TaxID=3364017 RepID=UPI0036A0A55C